MRTYLCVMSVSGARSAVFARTGRVLSITSQATRNFLVLEVSTGTVTCCYNSMFTGMYRVGMNVPLKTNRANKYAHVHMCHKHVRRTACSVCAYGAHVVHHFPSNFLVLEGFHRHRHPWFQLDVHWNVPGMNVPLKTNRANKYAHVPPCPEHEWRTVCSV